jgi:D-serine deaminase-like pyridoxal phosphate-dependent protein
MTYDLVIKNGIVVDGTGAKRYQADVAIADGKVAEIGKVTEGAKRTIDADGLVVAPGFVDPHTHYDAQICWDGAVTPSSWHGVTSVVMGNCGVGIAPCKPETREIAMKDLVNVEGIPFDVLNKGITWDWETFPQFMDAAAARKPSLNLAFIAPLTPFRHYVMGEASMERAASPEETVKIARLIGEAVDAGALGFSSTTLNQHMGFEGKPLACRNASRDELKAYANQLKKRGKGAIEIALTRQVGVLEQDQCELLDFLLTESGRPVTFIALFDRDDIPEAVRDTLRRAAPMIAKGARPQTSPLPLTREINMRNPFSFAGFPAWKRVFVDKSKEAQAAVYRDVSFRNQFREDLKKPLEPGMRQSPADRVLRDIDATRCRRPAFHRERGHDERGCDGDAAPRDPSELSIRASPATGAVSIVDAGMKTLTHEFGLPRFKGRGDLELLGLSEEHGTAKLSDPSVALKPGETLEIIPSHGDTTLNIHDYYYGIRNGRVETVWPIAARGKSR